MEEKVNTFNFSKIIIFLMFISVGPDIIGDRVDKGDGAFGFFTVTDGLCV